MTTHLVIHHKVEDRDKWMSEFESHGAIRKENGCLSEQVLSSSDDPNDLTVICGWDSVENAKRFTGSSDLESAMKRAGVVGKPEFSYLEDVGA